MALTVTPGGASDDALVSLAAFKVYADARGWDYSAIADAALEASIRRGTVFVEGVGGPTESLPSRWPGTKASASQRRLWPRVGARDVDGLAIDSTTIPPAIEDASCEAAWFDATNPGVLFRQVTPSQAVKQTKVGPLSKTYQDVKSAADYRPMLTAVNDLLAGILIPDLSGPSLFMQSLGPRG